MLVALTQSNVGNLTFNIFSLMNGMLKMIVVCWDEVGS